MQMHKGKKIRYAVVGLGHIAQTAILPAFQNARRNSALTAFVSDDPLKHRTFGDKYGVEHHYSYSRYDECLRSGQIDAVYIALPNHLHSEFTIKAARAGIHILCEKPLAVTARECREMIRACSRHRVKLMTAYRLHFEKANLKAGQIVRSGKIGEPQIFNSLFSFQVREKNYRVRAEAGGGTLYDIGIYCINAARHLFGAEPEEVFATSVYNLDSRSRDVDAITSAILRFPKDRMATFSTSFASSSIGTYTILGTKGHLRLDNAYEYARGIEMTLSIDGKEKRTTVPKRDQFGPELIYFSDCILKNKQPEPSGQEGLIDVQIIEALRRSARIGKPVKLALEHKLERPTMEQEIHRPPVGNVRKVRVTDPATD